MLRTLSEIRGLQDPIKQSQVEFIISETPALKLARATQKVAGLLSGNTKLVDSETFRLRCTSFSYPGPKIGQTELILGGHRRKLGTIQNKSGVWRCKVTEDFEGGVLNTIQAWCDLIHSNVLGTRVPSILYRTTAQVILGGSSDGGKVDSSLKSRTIWLQGFYPISYKVNDIDPNSSDVINVDIEFNYDYYSDNSYSILAQLG